MLSLFVYNDLYGSMRLQLHMVIINAVWLVQNILKFSAKYQNVVMGLMSKDVKFIVLMFFNVTCIVLCGWYGIKNVLEGKTRADTKLQNRHDVKQVVVDILLNPT